MNFKKITLLTASCLSAVAGVFLLNSSPKEQYFPRAENSFQSQEEIHSGYVEYMKSIRNNRETGTISSAEVNAAMKQASKLRSGNKALNLTWTFKGPDNVGGRTRAIIIDNADTNHLYAGAVSGGVWESFDAGLSWNAYDDDFKIQNVSTMAQAPNGDVYVGTGAFFDGIVNNKSVGSDFVGNGLWKLTGNGNSDLIVGPAGDFNAGFEWSTMAKVAIDPNNSQRIFVAMNRGLRESIDGGQTWTNPLGITSACHDVHITSDNKIVVAYANTIRVSLDDGLTWNTSNFINARRLVVAISPSNTDIMYISANSVNSSICVDGVYRSNDAGLTWSKLLNTPNYMGNPISCQGFYDNAIAVSPNDPGKIIAAGVSMFQWRQSSVDPAPVQGEWKVIATTSEFRNNGARNSFYVHADKHTLVFHPTNDNKLYIGSDGGIGFSDNMNNSQPIYGQYNSGYNVTQFYDIGVSPKGLVAGGTQDNGTQLVGLNFNTGKSAVEVRGGDGFDTELFAINSELGITSLYFGNLTRLQGIGTSLGGSTFNNAAIYSGVLAALGGSGFVPRYSEVFYTTVAKWESFNHTATKDSVLVRDSKTELPPVAANTVIQYASKNNKLPLEATLAVGTFPRDTTTINPNSSSDTLSVAIDTSTKVVTFINAFDTITVNEDSMTIEFKYRGKVSEFKPFTYGAKVDYNNIFHNDLSRALPPRQPLSITVVRDAIREQSEVFYINPQVEFNYQYEFPDLVQSSVAVFNIRGTLPTQGNQRHVYISKDVQKGSEVTEPRWIKVAGNNSIPQSTPNSNNAIAAVFSNDGDKLFYGTTGGDLYRIDNLNEIDLSQLGVSLPSDYTVDNTTKHRKIFDFGNRAVTGIAVDPNNDDNMIVTLGNYGSTQYVQRSTNATDAGVVEFVQISGTGTGQLPNSPVYEAVIDFQDNNKVIIGTELGVFATDNAFTSASYPIDTTYLRADTTIILADTTITPADTTFSPADTIYVMADTNYIIADTIVRLDTAITVDSSYIATRTQIDSSVVPPIVIVLDSALKIDTISIIFALDTTYIAADTTYIAADTTYIPILIVSTTPADTVYVIANTIIIPADTTVITRPDVIWTEENTGLGRAPVMSIKQMTFGWNEGAINQGKIYIGTHGRGIFESGQLVGVSENKPNTSAKKGKNNLIIYPNPAVNQLNIQFDAISNGLVNVQIYNLNGQLVKELQPTNLQNGLNTMNVNVEELSRGTYIIRSLVNGVSTTGKFIKQ